MADLRAAARVSLAGSRWNAGVENGRSRTATPSATAPTATAPTTPEEPDECLPSQILADIEIIAAFLAVEKPALRVVHALERVRDGVEKLAAKPKPTSTETAVR